MFLFLKIIFVFLENSRKNMGIPFPLLFFFLILPLPQDGLCPNMPDVVILRGNPVTGFMDLSSQTGCRSATASKVYLKPSSFSNVLVLFLGQFGGGGDLC